MSLQRSACRQALISVHCADRLAFKASKLQDLQIPEHLTNRNLPRYIFPCRFPEKQRLTFSRPHAILVVPTKRVPRTNPRYPSSSKKRKEKKRKENKRKQKKTKENKRKEKKSHASQRPRALREEPLPKVIIIH
eukprot:1161437-Pelagomonas_calceolata.AAC.6